MGVLYAKDSKIYNSVYFEIYVPTEYFESNTAINHGSSVETLGLVYCRAFPNGKESKIQMMNLPVVVNFMVYESRPDTITVHGHAINVLALSYMKDSYILHQTIPNGRDVANMFLSKILAGKIPKTINYDKLLDIWWKNLYLSGVSFKVPSVIYEMILACIYRDPHNPKRRYGQYYGASSSATGYDYKTGSVRDVVKNLSTFSGMTFEDMNSMITVAINNAAENVEEPESPLEKIIHL